MDAATISLSTLYTILNWAVLGGGSLVAVYVIYLHLTHPPDYEKCTQTLVSRAWRPLHMGQLLIAIVLYYLLASGIGQFFYEEQLPLVRLVVTLSIYAVLLSVIHDITRRTGSWAKNFGMGWSNLRALRWSPVLYLAIIPFIWASTQIYYWMLQVVFQQQVTTQDVVQVISHETSWLDLGYILMAVFAAPIYEELVFRGILFPYLTKRFGLEWSIVVVSALFALIHLHLPSAVPLFLLSTALCLAYWRTGSLWVSIGIHAIFNGVTALSIKLMG